MNITLRQVIIAGCGIVAAGICAFVGFEFIDEDVVKWLAAAGVLLGIGLAVTVVP